ncbi:hypothetical protein ASE85_03290 [Sphingobium sp. Leaf26]|uniref:hypothetical protein n=1 Tax=Sphingobium sp. Leaf26 TaxID=1735693 RepID=UPI0006F50FC9|nr:hypothetical protein [Sphingobium sp. Leaf26]KQN09968.1 hypothetical protein ASE85_03290 [Sphingobium sp. Leaf26]
MADHIPTREECDTYHNARLNPDWSAAADAVKEAAILRAYDYIERTYLFEADPDVATILAAIKAATIVLAPFATNSTLTAAAEPMVVMEKGDGLGEIQYSDRPIGDPYPFITAMLKPVASRNGGGFRSAKVIL